MEFLMRARKIQIVLATCRSMIGLATGSILLQSLLDFCPVKPFAKFVTGYMLHALAKSSCPMLQQFVIHTDPHSSERSLH